MRKVDLTGERFGTLTILREVPKPFGSTQCARYWLAVCDCGETVIAASTRFLSQQAKCDCQKKRRSKLKNTQGWDCPAPYSKCKINASGICCHYCDKKYTCEQMCLNHPDMCAL